MTRPHSPITADSLDGLLLDTSPYLSCDECFENMDIYVEKIIADPEHQDVPMQVHLAGCPACAEEADTLVELLTSEPA